MFGMFMVFPRLMWRCAMDPFAWPDLPESEEKPKPKPELDEPEDGE
jgi:hypothetical protein